MGLQELLSMETLAEALREGGDGGRSPLGLENLTFLWLSAGSFLVTPPWVSGVDTTVLEHPASS